MLTSMAGVPTPCRTEVDRPSPGSIVGSKAGRRTHLPETPDEPRRRLQDESGRGPRGLHGDPVEVSLRPHDFLRDWIATRRTSAWLDHPCGAGKAVIEAARIVHDEGST